MQVAEIPPKRVSASTKASNPVEDTKTSIPTYPLIRYADLPDIDKQEIVDIVSESLELYGSTPEEAAKVIKERMDKSYNPNWHVVVGESFAFDVSYEPSSLIFLFHGPLATAIWKSD